MNIVALPNVLINYISSFLAFGEIFAFRLANSEIDRKVLSKYKDFNLVMKSRLAKCLNQEVDIDEFLHILYKTKCKISGSFILQCITGDEWSCESDIDIFYMNIRPEYWWDEIKNEYCPKPVLNELTGETSYIVNGDYNKTIYDEGEEAKSFITYMNKTFISIYQEYDDRSFAFSALSLPYSYKTKHELNSKRLDIIGIYHSTSVLSRNEEYLETLKKYKLKDVKSYNSLFDYIGNETDMEFLKCIYDGKKLYVKNWNSIWNRKCKYFYANLKLIPFYYKSYYGDNHETTYITRMYNRIHKYRKRGFTVHSDIDTVIHEAKFIKYIKCHYVSNHASGRGGRGGTMVSRGRKGKSIKPACIENVSDYDVEYELDSLKTHTTDEYKHYQYKPQVMIIYKNKKMINKPK